MGKERVKEKYFGSLDLGVLVLKRKVYLLGKEIERERYGFEIREIL